LIIQGIPKKPLSDKVVKLLMELEKTENQLHGDLLN